MLLYQGTPAVAVTAANRKWESLNGSLAANSNLSISEANSVGYDPINDVITTGTQDNGSQQQVLNDPRFVWETTTGGDGNTQGVGVEADPGTSAWMLKRVFDREVTPQAIPLTISLPQDSARTMTKRHHRPDRATGTVWWR